MLLSSFFTRSMAFTHMHKVQLPFALFSETFLTIRQNSLYVTVYIIARPSYRGYFIHSLSTLHYCNTPSLATRLTGDYRDRTYTGQCDSASLDTLQKKETIYGHFLICYLSLFLLKILEIKCFKNKINSYDLVNFMRDFRVIDKGDGTYINISQNQSVNEKIKNLIGLTNLDALYLTEKEIENIFEFTMLIDN